MSLSESIVASTALESLAELGYAVGRGPLPAPGELAPEWDSFRAVVLVRCPRKPIRRPAAPGPAIPQSRTIATLRHTLLPKLLIGTFNTTNIQ